MSKAAYSAKAFALYLFVVGPILLVAPNMLLALFGIATTTEVWIRIVGLLALMLGVYSWVAARHELTAFLEASVSTRCMVSVALTAFVVLGMASPMLILFAVTELAGAAWTFLALRADARTLAPISTGSGALTP